MKKVPKKVLLYQDSQGRKPVREFIDDLEDKAAGKVTGFILYLSEHWHEAKRPMVDYLGDNLYELRVKFSPNNIRMIYAYMFKDYIVLSHGLIKNTDKVPETDKLIAKKRMIDFQIQYKRRKIKLP